MRQRESINLPYINITLPSQVFSYELKDLLGVYKGNKDSEKKKKYLKTEIPESLLEVT